MRRRKNTIGRRIFKCRTCGALFSYRGRLREAESLNPEYAEDKFKCYHYRRLRYNHLETAIAGDGPLRGERRYEELPKEQVRLIKLLYGKNLW